MPNHKRGLKAIPRFRAEAEERRFWETHDSTEYVDWAKARPVTFPNLKPSTETISLRLPAPLLSDLKALANRRDVPYQSLLKVFLADRVSAEWQTTSSSGALSNKRLQPTKTRGRAPTKRGTRTRLRG
jgi:predicted DNA binding CopG/RHH family protein